MGYDYFPSYDGAPFDLMVGSDFQSSYHEEKRRDAHQSVLNGLQARRTMNEKLLTGPHNYHIPKPVLGQRRYANPMCGAESFVSTRRDNGPEAPFKTIEVGREGGMRGGVVTSLEGQQFYKGQLAARIAQLNRINAVAQGFAVEMGQQYKTEDNTKNGPVDKVEFFLYLRALMDTVVQGDISRFTFENLKEMIQMMFAFGPTMSIEDIDDMRKSLDTMIMMIRDGLMEGHFADQKAEAYSETLLIFTSKMRNYIDKMEANINLQEKDKRTLSNSLKKSLGFDRMLTSADFTQVIREERASDGRVDTSAEDYDGSWGDDGDDGGGDGRFDQPRTTREDDEAGGAPRQPFAGRSDDPNRKLFGEKTGLVVFGGPSYFGESESQLQDSYEDQFPQYVAPLGLAGSDPNALSVPQSNPTIISEAAEDVISQVLEPLGYVEGATDLSEFITTNYPDKNMFVNEVVKAMEERGFSKAEIASGLMKLKLDVFSEFIGENMGSTTPEPIQRAPPNGLTPLGGLAPPIYRDMDDDGMMDVAQPDAIGLQGSEPPTKDQKTQILLAAGFPLTRQDMYAMANTAAKYKMLGERLPREVGGPYNMRSGTTVKNAKARIIALMKANYDPNW